MKLVSKSDIANLAKNNESDRKGSNIYKKKRQLKYDKIKHYKRLIQIIFVVKVILKMEAFINLNQKTLKL